MQATRILLNKAAPTASASVSQVARRTKISTGITGIAVHPEPLHRLKAVYTTTLSELASLPASSVYRQSAESITQHRLKQITAAEVGRQGEDAVVALEQNLDGGVAEQLIETAEAELSLVKKMQEWKAWERLEEQPNEDQWQYFDVPPSTTNPDQQA